MATVRIGHASTDSRPANDQVVISSYYNGDWIVVLRPKNYALAEKSARICEAGCNNNYVRYSQGSRHKLKAEALKIANLSDTDANLAKITPENVAAIKTVCYADCSSFMTFCAIVGGASFSYGSNAATTSTMKTRFTEKGDYVALTSKEYLNSSDYLQRGDILVNNGHTVMVLDSGAKAAEITPPADNNTVTTAPDNSYLDIINIKVVAELTTITATAIKGTVKISKIAEGKEKSLADKTELSLYKWSYELKPLEGSGANITGSLSVASATNNFSVSSLSANKAYALTVKATEKKGNGELNSSTLIFKTLNSYPSSVNNLDIQFKTNLPDDNNFSIAFKAPDTWGSSSLSKCYRLILFVNGRQAATNDSVISTTGSYEKAKVVKISEVTSNKNLFTYNDVIQIGILPGLKSAAGVFTADETSLKCSKPIYLRSSLSPVNKIFVQVAKAFKQVMLYKE